MFFSELNLFWQPAALVDWLPKSLIPQGGRLGDSGPVCSSLLPVFTRDESSGPLGAGYHGLSSVNPPGNLFGGKDSVYLLLA